jgi:hypothetical protein
LGLYLWKQGRPTATPTTILFVICAGVIGVVLLELARRVREWNLPREAWVPVALVGTALLNPRVMKYDLAAITVPMLLIGGRAVRLLWKAGGTATEAKNRSGRTLILAGSILFFLIPNVITTVGPSWFPGEVLVLATVFVLGVWSVWRFRVERQPADRC